MIFIFISKDSESASVSESLYAALEFMGTRMNADKKNLKSEI